ncbi:MAG: InlB B-repeat-containing protein [Clostridia bacterium]|nr:InlB B-repeat-containing protein [Clostridia bacterium]
MKKILAFVLTLLTVFVFASCSGGGSDSSSDDKLSVDKVTGNLSDAGYELEEMDKEELNELVDQMNSVLENLGEDLLTGNIVSAVVGYDEEKKNTVSIYEFESSADAKKIVEILEKQGFICDRDGKVVIVTNNEDALKDATGGSGNGGSGNGGSGSIGGGGIGDRPSVGMKETTTVYFDANGGNGTGNVEVSFYSGFSIPNMGFYRDGYKLLGWSKDPYATEADYSVNGWYYNNTEDESATLYAVWGVDEFLMWFQPNGADASAVVITVGSDGFYLPYNNFVRDGYIFVGWSLYSDSAVGEYSEDYYFDSYDGSINFYAIWQKEEAEIVFNSNDGKGNVSTLPLSNGAILTMPGSYFDRAGYKFLGWSTDSSATEPEYTEGESFYNTPFAEKIEFYAVWEKNETPVIDVEGLYERDGYTIYFGSYPQTQVTDLDIAYALETMAGSLPSSYDSYNWTSYGYYANGYSQDYMWYIDLEYNGEMYRGVYFTSYRPMWNTESNSSSDSDQDDNGYYTGATYWFKYEPIAWEILSENDGVAFIAANLVIDAQPYNNETDVAGYSAASVRDWLNETFYETAFNELQRKIILTTSVDNSDSGYDTATTEDKIFLLSQSEVINYNYELRKNATDYAFCQGLLKEYDREACYWFLRTSENREDVKTVLNGSLSNGAQVAFSRGGMLPAMRIMTSGQIEDGDVGGDVPSIDIDGLYERDGNTIYFGSYPQSQVTDSDITYQLDSLAGSLPSSYDSYNWTSYRYYYNGDESDFMWYIDLEYNGEYYRGVYFDQYRSCWTHSYNTAQQGDYKTYTVYWFKYEPISWTILSENGDRAVILADLILDSKEYTTYDGDQTYEYTTIRAWLNEVFYETAFNELQKQLILQTSVDGYLNDKIFILSSDEVQTYFSYYEKNSTAYAKCQGLEQSNYWRLRGVTGRWDYSMACSRGDINEIYKYYTPAGVVPALTIYLGVRAAKAFC